MLIKRKHPRFGVLKVLLVFDVPLLVEFYGETAGIRDLTD